MSRCVWWFIHEPDLPGSDPGYSGRDISGLPSPLKSPTPPTTQWAGRTAMLAPRITVVLSISHTEHHPVFICSARECPFCRHPSKSSRSHDLSTPRARMRSRHYYYDTLPFISHTMHEPVVLFCHSRCPALPSRLKSATAAILHCVLTPARVIQLPGMVPCMSLRHHATTGYRILPDNVGSAIAIEIAESRNVPSRSYRAEIHTSAVGRSPASTKESGHRWCCFARRYPPGRHYRRCRSVLVPALCKRVARCHQTRRYSDRRLLPRKQR